MKKAFLFLLSLLAAVGVQAESDGQELNVERFTDMGYGVTTATVDFTAAKAFLGVEELTTSMLRIVNPDGQKISNYATYDGWFNAEGVATTWGSTTAICVKFFQAIPDGKYEICDMNGADEVGKTYTVKWALVNGEKEFVYTINVLFVKEPTLELELKEGTLNVERYPGLGYNVTEAEVDFTEAKEYLGVETLTTDMLRVVSPDGTMSAGYGNYDGWFNAEGVPTTWGSTTAICVKFFQAIPNGKYEICDMNGADEVGKTYTVKWALVKDQKGFVYTINVKFVEKPTIALTYDDLNIKGDGEICLYSELGNYYEDMSEDVDVAAILAALGVSSLDDVTIYAVQSDNSLDDNYKTGLTDGWRNAEGDWQDWGNEAYFYVKADFSAQSNQIYAVGGMDGKNTINDWENPPTYTARYVFVTANKDAILLAIKLTYEIVDYITINDASLYATYVTHFDVDFSNSEVNAFTVQDMGTYVHLEPVTIVPTGTAVIVKAGEAGTFKIYKTDLPAALGTTNDLKAATQDIIADGSQYVLANPEGEEIGFYPVTPETVIAKGKGYIQHTAGIKALYFNTETTIKNVNVSADADAVIYNMAGQRLNRVQKGVNIINGKKVLK